MKQFKTIFNFELGNYFKNKTFILVTALFVVVLGAVMFAPRVVESIDSDDQVDTGEEKETLVVVCDDKAMAEGYVTAFKEAFVDYNVVISEDNVEEIKSQIKSGEIEGAFKIESVTSYTYFVNDLTLYDMNTALADEVMTSIFRVGAMIGSGMSPEDAAVVLSTPIESKVENLGVDQAENFFYAYIMIFALYMVILLYGNMISSNVATEKSSRAMEVLITSAKPSSMMFGKVFAACLAGLTQLVAIFGSALVFYNINKDYWADLEIGQMFFDIPPELLGYMLVFFLLGFLVYAFLFGAVGSTVSKLEDINTAITPVMLVFIFQFFVVIFSMSGGNVDNTLIKVCSFIPFTSPMAMFTRIALSVVPAWEIAVSVGILAVSVFGIGALAAKIYRMGVLMYGNPMKLTTILKNLKR